MLVSGDFGHLEELAGRIEATVGNVQAEMQTWKTEAGFTAENWLDGAGDEFTAVSEAWRQVSEAQQTMLAELRIGVVQANDALQVALAASKGRIAGGV